MWELVWTYNDAWPDILSFAVVPGGAFLVGLIAYLVGRRILGAVTLIVAIAILGLSTWSLLSQYHAIKTAVENKTYGVVQGEVENYVSASERYIPEFGWRHESFTVEGTRFSYHQRTACFCFNQTAVAGGPIRPGLKVRIWHFDKKIIRLEIWKE